MASERAEETDVRVADEQQVDEAAVGLIARRLGELGPDWVILFGSRVRGEAAPESDYDVLVVKTGADAGALRADARAALGDVGVFVDVHAYGTDEFVQRLVAGDPLLREALEQGRVLYWGDRVMTSEDLTRNWLSWAEKDWEAAHELQVERFKGLVSFLAQQCAGKYLKAALLARGIRPERTHDLASLAAKVPGLAEGMEEELRWLSQFATRGRYEVPPVSVEEARRAVEIAGRVREGVRRGVAADDERTSS